MKECTSCNVVKPLDSFGKKSDSKDLLASACKSCKAVKDKEYPTKNKERLSAKAKEYRVKNLDKLREQKRNYYYENKEDCNARMAAYYLENKEKARAKGIVYREQNAEAISQRKKDYYAENRDKIIAYHKTRRLENPEPERERCRQYKLKNPDVVAALNRKRKAIKKGAIGTHTAADVFAIFDSQRGKCASCPLKLKKSGKNKFHVDHIMPLAKGGSNDKYNLQLLCPDCNLRKHAKDPIDWAQENGRLL